MQQITLCLFTNVILLFKHCHLWFCVKTICFVQWLLCGHFFCSNCNSPSGPLPELLLLLLFLRLRFDVDHPQLQLSVHLLCRHFSLKLNWDLPLLSFLCFSVHLTVFLRIPFRENRVMNDRYGIVNYVHMSNLRVFNPNKSNHIS